MILTKKKISCLESLKRNGLVIFERKLYYMFKLSNKYHSSILNYDMHY